MTGPFQPGWYPDRSGVPSVAASALHPKDDPFYSDDKPLEGVALGTVLMTRRLPAGSTRWPSRSSRVQSSRDMDLEMGSVCYCRSSKIATPRLRFTRRLAKGPLALMHPPEGS